MSSQTREILGGVHVAPSILSADSAGCASR